MRERAATIGAPLRISSSAGHGTRVSLLVRGVSQASSTGDPTPVPAPVASEYTP